MELPMVVVSSASEPASINLRIAQIMMQVLRLRSNRITTTIIVIIVVVVVIIARRYPISAAPRSRSKFELQSILGLAQNAGAR